MPAPLDPDKRAAILASIRAGGTCRGVAREHGVSPGTVRNIASDAGLVDPFARTQTENATRAKQADNKALRTELRHRLLVKAGQLLDQMDEAHTVFAFGGKDNSFNSHVLDKPPTSDLRNLMTSAAVAIDKHAVLERIDADNGSDSLGSLLGGVMDRLQATHGLGD